MTEKKVTKKVTKKATAKKVTKKTIKKVETSDAAIAKKTIAKKAVSKNITKDNLVKESASEKVVNAPKDKIIDTDETIVVDSADFTEEAKGPAEIVKEVLSEEVLSLAEDFALTDIFKSIQDLEFFRSKTDECLENGCDNPDTTLGYCRFHYIKNWEVIKKKQDILKSGKLQSLIADLLKTYPIKLLETVLNDLTDDKSFYNVLRGMNIDVAEEEEFEDASTASEDELGEDDDQDIAFETKGITPKLDE